MRRVNGWLTIFWLAMIPIAFVLGWLQSVVFVSALSLWALVSGHWSAWQAARVEVQQQKDEVHRESEPDRIVARIVEKTEINEASGQSESSTTSSVSVGSSTE